MAAKDHEAFNPRLERLVVEIRTEWAAVIADVPRENRPALARQLHADPSACIEVRYDRMHTGFCRVVVVSPEDLERLGVSTAPGP